MNWSETVNTPKSISELRRLRKCLAARKRMLTIQVKKTKARLDKVIHEDPTGKTPVQILNSSPLEVHKALAKILGVTSTDSQTLIRNLRETAQGFWPRRFSSKLPTYEKILKKVCKNSKIKVEHTLTIEQNIILYQFNRTWEKLSSEHQAAFKQKLVTEIDESPMLLGNLRTVLNYGPEILGAGGILVAQASGFGVYMASSTLVAALTSVIGIALPFTFYTIMSSAIAFFIGPAGCVGIVMSVLLKVFGSKHDKVGKAVLIIAAAREEARIKHTKERMETNEEIDRIQKSLNEVNVRLKQATKRYILKLSLIIMVSIVILLGAIAIFKLFYVI